MVILRPRAKASRRKFQRYECRVVRLTLMGLRMQSNAMRYDAEHKARTHKRIVRNASRQLRAKGLNGSAVTTLMKASGLTHGGFYRHFRSRDGLVVEAIEEGMQ